jgi:hypothetical protein
MITVEKENWGNVDIDGGIHESATLNDNLEHSGGITLTWNSEQGDTLSVGASVVHDGTKYSLLDPYTPQKAGPRHWRYEPCFRHPVARLSRVPFYITSRDAGGNVIQLSTSNFTGYAKTIANKLAAFFAEYGSVDAEFGDTFGVWTASFNGLNQETIGMITVDFDGCSISEAANRIADAIGCNVFFDWSAHAIRFVAGTSIEGDYYNCFHVLGGTTNMAKKTVEGLYAPVTQRLTLPAEYPGSIMTIVDNPPIRLTKDLIFENIYPKMELKVSSVRQRVCWMTDEEGKKVPTTAGDSQGRLFEDGQYYKVYAKWYVKLTHVDGTAFTFDPSTIVQDKNLEMLFHPDYTNLQTTSPLAGRQFEAVFFEADTPEWTEDDVLPQTDRFVAQAGEFRIIFTADNGNIIPSYEKTAGDGGLVPKVGNLVTLVNVALDDSYKQVAQSRLEEAARQIIGMMAADEGERTVDILPEQTLPTIGSGSGNSVVVGLNYNLDTQAGEATCGSWRSKTNLGGIRDKIESISTSGGESTTAPEKGVSGNSADLLRQTQTKPLAKKIESFGTDIEAIKGQQDKKFFIHFGSGDPTDPATTDNPAIDWTTDEVRAEHVQDIYYDKTRAAASSGGRAWRWVLKDGEYVWEPITDADTLAALEKIADVASDGILSGGAEKQRIFVDFTHAKSDFANYKTQVEGYGVDTEWEAYNAAYVALWRMLNGGADDAQEKYTATPAWISTAHLGTDTKLSDYNVTPAQYRTAWNDYYAALSALTDAVTGKGKQLTAAATTLAASKMAYHVSSSVPQPPYQKGDLWLKSSNGSGTEGTLYLCVTTRTTGSGQITDWLNRDLFKERTEAADLLSLYGALGVMLTEHFKATGRPAMWVWYGGDHTSEGNTGDIWYTPAEADTSASFLVCKNVSGERTWTPLFESDGELTDEGEQISYLLDSIYALDKRQVQNRTSYVLCKTSYVKQYPSYKAQHVILMSASSFSDPITGTPFESEMSIFALKDGEWVCVRESSKGVLENYADHILAVVYGSNYASAKAAGLSVTKNFAQMFAQAADAQTGELKAKAGITVHTEDVDDGEGGTVQQGFVDIEGTFRSADNKVRIGVYENIPDEGPQDYDILNQNIGILMGEEDGDGNERNFVQLFYNDYQFSYGHVYNPILQLTQMIAERYGGTNFKRSEINGGTISACGFKVLVFDTNNYNQYHTIKFDEYSGVDGTFETADGKTVTVMGGIITDIS